MIAIVDYDVGNVASVLNMLKKIGAQDVRLTRNPDEIARADKVILPGVGAFDTGMRNLIRFDLLQVLHHSVLSRKVPVLGICLGMQLMTNQSDEGKAPGLGWIPGTTRRFSFPDDSGLKIPHMGWNYIAPTRHSQLFTEHLRMRFYFVHSYYVECDDSADVVATAKYGIEFPCAVNKGNVYGVQFHPEKSHRFGMSVLESFISV